MIYWIEPRLRRANNERRFSWNGKWEVRGDSFEFDAYFHLRLYRLRVKPEKIPGEFRERFKADFGTAMNLDW